ncbi:MAG: hypothetical protein ACOY71_05635, partial [Gemmatimonadota bacterium]
MKCMRMCVALVMWAMATVAPAMAQRISVEAFGGSAWSANTPLWIEQQGQPDIHFVAAYETRPFKETWYYAGRIGFWDEHRRTGWMAELLHHKIYLRNTRPDVQDFRITFGYNIITGNRAWRRGNQQFSAGAGLVLAHPFSTVRGKSFTGTGRGVRRGVLQDGFFVAGPAVVAGAGRRIPLALGFFVSLEAKVS